MTYWIGCDEAGYGPNLGPLLIAASVWRAPDEPPSADTGDGDVDFYARLAASVTAEPAALDQRLALADSKRLYQPGGSWRLLERGVLSLLHVLARPYARRRAIWRSLAADDAARLDTLPWRPDDDPPAPRDATPDDIAATAARLASDLAVGGLTLVDFQARAVFPAEFNAGCQRWGSKGELLSRTTLGLARRLIDALPGDEPIVVLCDRHGGRRRYAGLLQSIFPEHLVEVRRESPAQSVYRWGPAGRRVEFRFTVGGESQLPTAAASLAAKYLRELAMDDFNRFWRGHLPDLRPTAGYPVDARRFLDEIAPLLPRLAIDEHVVWRQR